MTGETIEKLRELRRLTNAGMKECTALLSRFDGNVERAVDHWFDRQPRLERFLGFQNPFPVRLPFPEWIAVYDQLLSLSLKFDGNSVLIEMLSQWSDTKKTVPYPVRCRTSQRFDYLPNVRTPEDAFEDWMPEVNRIYEQDKLESNRLRAECSKIFPVIDGFGREVSDPFLMADAWAFHEIQNRGGISVEECGKGILVSASMGFLGYAGGGSMIYLISRNGDAGALRYGDQAAHFYFEQSKIQIGVAGDWPELPTLTSEPIELVTSTDSAP